MADHGFELLRAAILAVLLVVLLRAGRGFTLCQGPGWRLRMAGLALIMLGEAGRAFPGGEVRALGVQLVLTFGVCLLSWGFWLRMAALREMSIAGDKLQHSQEQYRRLVENQGDFVVQLDHESRFTFVSQAFCALFGKGESELLGTPAQDLAHPDDRPARSKALADVADGAPSRQVEERAQGLFGERWLHWVFTPAPDSGLASDASMPEAAAHGALRRTSIGVGRDITDRRLAEELSRQAAARVQSIVESSPLGLMIYRQNALGSLVLAGSNPAADMLLGAKLQQSFGRTVEELFPGRANDDIPKAFRAVCATGEPYHNDHLEYREGAVSGTFAVKAFRTSPNEMALFFENVTERERIESQLETLALFDPLTGLPNRTLLLDRLSRALQRRKRKPDYRHAVLFVDLDRFKTVNDSLGHQAGDAVLCETAARIQSSVRTLDTVARVGGDEFVVLLEEFDSYRTAVMVLKRIRQALSSPLVIEGREVCLGSSIGLALGISSEDQAEEVLRKAELAMHFAKERGRNRFKAYTPSLLRQTQRRVRLEQDLDKAMEQGQLRLVYQPVVRLLDGGLSGFETLVRWDHPELGPVTPGEFIPLAEESGKIIELDRWILHQACTTFVEWMGLFPQVKALCLSVNLSAKHITRSDFTAHVLDVLERTGMPAASLKLEITETSLMLGGPEMTRKLEHLRSKGVRFSIDDFGTGYSSMAYLNRLPLDDLKLDIAFVRHLETRMDTQEIVRAILSLARGLGMSVVAEGVEVTGQREALRAMGCEMAQGYLIARPMTRQQVEETCLALPVAGPAEATPPKPAEDGPAGPEGLPRGPLDKP